MHRPIRLMASVLAIVGGSLLGLSLAADADDKSKNRLTYPVNGIYKVQLDEAINAESQGNFDKAIGIYRTILQENADPDPNRGNRVMPFVDAEGNPTGRYQGISEFVRARLRALPEEGRKAFRENVDRWVHQELERIGRGVDTGDPVPLLDALYADNFLATEAPAALERAADFDFERGEVEAALERYWQLLRAHPDRAPVTELRTKAAVCCALTGNVARLRLILERMRAVDPALELELGGRVIEGETLVQRALEVARERALAGESAERGALGTGAVSTDGAIRLGQHLWDQPTAGRVMQTSRQRQRGVFGLGDLNGRQDTSNASPHYPVVVGGRLALPSADKLAVFDLDDGRPLFGRGLQVRAAIGHEETNDRVIYGGTSHRDIFVAPFVQRVFNEEYWRGIPIKVRIPVRKLAAYDGKTWKLLWDHSEMLRGTALEAASFPTPPAAQGGVIYTSAFIVRGFVQSWLAAFDARSGELLWQTWLCGGQVEQTMFGEHAIEPYCSPPIAHGDTVYHVTSFGAIAAVEARTGRIRWMTEYDQIAVQAAKGYYPVERDIEWRNAPPVLVPTDDEGGAVLVCTPLDSDYYYGIDAETGAKLWNYHRDDLQYLVGARDGLAVLAGNDRIIARNVSTGKLEWEIELSRLPYAKTEIVAGRGAIAGPDAVIPLRRRLLSIEVATGKISAVSNNFNNHSNGGNVFAWGRRVFIAAPSRVHVYENRATNAPQDDESATPPGSEQERPGERRRKKF